MTDYRDSSGSSLLRSDGIDINGIPRDLRLKFAQEGWASGARFGTDQSREILRIDLQNRRLINHIALEVGMVPHRMTIEYLDAGGQWQALRKAPQRRYVGVTPSRVLPEGEPVEWITYTATPVVYPPTNPQGTRVTPDWESMDFKVAPVTTSAVRVVMTRVPGWNGPRDHRQESLPYPVSVRNLLLGYKVEDEWDAPSSGFPSESAIGKDALGNPVSYGSYRQTASRMIDGSSTTFWKSDPQPIASAVVNAYLDVRTEDGDPVVVDRFWIDPVTPGVHCTLYYAKDVPENSFRGLSDVIDPRWITEVGVPHIPRDPKTGEPTFVTLTPMHSHRVSTSAFFGDLGSYWWIGVDVLAPYQSPQKIISVQGAALWVGPGRIEVEVEGERFVIESDLVTSGAQMRVALSVSPTAPGTMPSLTISWQVKGHESQSETFVFPDSYHTLNYNYIEVGGGYVLLAGAVVKAEVATPEALEWFLDEGVEFINDPLSEAVYRGADVNAVWRLSPRFVTPENPYGVVGGVGSTYDTLVWTPVHGDYVLKRGYLAISPTLASVWKFEMTNLVPEVFENLKPLDRKVKTFPQSVVDEYTANSGPRDSSAVPPGTSITMTAQQWGDTQSSFDAEIARKKTGDPSRSTVLVLPDPSHAARAANSGWVWQYQKWHSGLTAPRFVRVGQHRYVEAVITHNWKVAYFAGIREIQPLRTAYWAIDDTEEYSERFEDGDGIAVMDNVEIVPMGLRSTSRGVAEGTIMRSYRNVRGLQFATQQPDMVQVIEDPDFAADNLLRWSEYGDATISRRGPGSVVVSRGWSSNTYEDLENRYQTYAGLEADDKSYMDLEGYHPTGSAEGGIESLPVIPSGPGEIEARVLVSVDRALTQPLTVEIVDATSGNVIATRSVSPPPGEVTEVLVTSAASGTRIAYTWGDHEAKTYAELEESTYSQLESVEGSTSGLKVRIVQHGESTDTFEVRRIALYESPIAWYFSNDNGASWWQAIGIRNSPHGVLTFPTFFGTDNPAIGRALKWRAKFSRAGIVLSALHIRPWYGIRGRGAEASYGNDSHGPVLSLRDSTRPTYLHPMWQERTNPVEHTFVPEVPTWRNLAINPSGESPVEPGDWTADGADVSTVPSTLGPGRRSIEITITEGES